VGGLWRTSVELKDEATWLDLKKEIEKVAGISRIEQNLKPTDEDNKNVNWKKAKPQLTRQKKLW